MHGGTNTERKERHDGKTVGEAAIAVTVGIYADVGLHDDEYPIYDGIVQKLGTLDEELHMARIKLRRCYKAQLHWEEVRDDLAGVMDNPDAYMQMAVDHNILELDEITTQDGKAYVPSGEKGVPGEIEDVASVRMKRKIKDYASEIRSYSNLIRTLEATRVELLASGTGGDDYVRQLSEDLRDFEAGAQATMPGGTNFGAGNYDET